MRMYAVDEIYLRLADSTRRLNLLIHKKFRVTTGEQREEQNTICFGGELGRISGEKNDGYFRLQIADC